jgi:outer membrane protein assembly factor BamB
MFLLLLAAPWLSAGQDVLTYHNDNARAGLNGSESVLTTANVNVNQFGKVLSVPLDGYVYAQPLILTGVSIPSQGVHNVVYVATEHESLYAIDADNGAVLWQVSFIDPSAGVTTVSSDDVGCDDLVPEVGITGTPVIDRGTGTIYLVAKTKENGTFVQRLHAIDVADHSEKFGGPVMIQASVAGSGDGSFNGAVSFNPLTANQRAGLLLQNGHVIIGWASYCDNSPYHGWVMSYNGATLAQEAVFNATPNGSDGGIWMGGAAFAADASANIFFNTGNGTFDGSSDFGDTLFRLSQASDGTFTVADWFTPYNQADLNVQDNDLGAGGVLLLPDLPSGSPHPHLLVQADKIGTIYLIDRDNLGHYCSTCANGDTQIVQELPYFLNGMFGMPAYWNGNIYFGARARSLMVYSFNAAGSGLLSTTPTSVSAQVFQHPAPTPSVSANGNANGIVWVLENGSFASSCCQTLHAYDATNLASELYNSNQAASNRDLPGGAVKFTVPTISNGRVYVGTQTGLVVYGLLAAFAATSPSKLSFGNQPVGTTSPAQQVVLANAGATALTLTSITASAGYTETDNCPGSLPARASCIINVAFLPAVNGADDGTLSITDSSTGSPQTVALTGTGGGAGASLSTASLNFGGQLVTTTSPAQRVTVQNTGNAPLSISGITVTGDFTQTNNCGSSLAANASCAISVTFVPAAGGARSGTLTIADNAPGSPQTVGLTGAGEDFTLDIASGSSTSATISAGGSATYTLGVAGVSGFSQEVALACSGAPPKGTCTVSPASLTISGSATVNAKVMVSTMAASQAMRWRGFPPPHGHPLSGLLWLPVLMLMVLAVWRQASRSRPSSRNSAPALVLWILTLVSLVTLACGGVGAGARTPGTPSGTYPLTVTATYTSGSTTLKHTVTLNLIVR